MKSTMIGSINKKADYHLLDQIKDQLHKKVDVDYMNSVVGKVKAESQTQISQIQSDFNYQRKGRDDKVDEKVTKAEMNADRALDEIFFIRDQLKQIQEDRKKDVEETADFIKQIINQGKQEQQKDLQMTISDFERLRREMADKCNVTELFDFKQKMQSSLDKKVDLKEVQEALNQCQKEITTQLGDFKRNLKSDVGQVENDLNKMIERKANVLDVQDALSQKADLVIVENCVPREEFQEIIDKSERMSEELLTKVDSRGKIKT